MSIEAYLKPSPHAHDPRRGVRHTLHLEALGVTSAGEGTSVTIHNISAGGLLIETDASLGLGATLTLELPEAGERHATVTWTSGAFLGCQFDVALTTAELSAAQLRATVSDTRAAVRAPLAGLDNDFGHRLQHLRKERGMTLAQVAELLGVSKPTVWAWEQGRSRPVARRIEPIAEALGVGQEQLYRDPNAASSLTDLLARVRGEIADAAGTTPDKIRIMIEM